MSIVQFLDIHKIRKRFSQGKAVGSVVTADPYVAAGAFTAPFAGVSFVGVRYSESTKVYHMEESRVLVLGE